MANAKKKSSGWRPDEKRHTPEEWQARRVAARVAELRRDCDRLALWRTCAAKLCLRFRRCTGDPEWCSEQRWPQIAEKHNGAARAEAAPARVAAAERVTASVRSPAAATGNEAPRFALSASDAAAAIAASIADVTAPGLLPGEQLEAIIRDGSIHYEPRRRR